MSKRRVATAALLGVFAVGTIFFEWLFVLTIIVMICRGLYEFFTLIEKKGIPMYKYFGTILGAVIPSSIFFRFEMTKGWEFLFISLTLVTLFILQFSRRDSTHAVIAISTTLFGILYISWFFSFMIKIRLLPYGTALIGALLLMTKGADIGAFLVGMKWGRRVLIPRISPKKTVEGAIGAVVFGILGALASWCFLPHYPVFSWGNMILIGASLGLLGILGDLSESLIKRDCAIKDSSAIFPGIGGVMDVIDSLLFTAPAFYFFMNFYLSRAFSNGPGF